MKGGPWGPAVTNILVLWRERRPLGVRARVRTHAAQASGGAKRCPAQTSITRKSARQSVSS